MNQILSDNLWPTVKRLSKNASIRAAVAYVSSDKNLRLGEGDLLICDASPTAIKSAQTDAKVLKHAYERGAEICSLPGLHAKVILLDDKAVIGSANASLASANSLVEAGLLSDQISIVSNAQDFINQVYEIATKLSESDIAKLLKMEVVRKGHLVSRKRTHRVKVKTRRTWIIGIEDDEENDDVAIAEKLSAIIEQCESDLISSRSGVSRLKWHGSSGFRKYCQAGDWIIQYFRPSNKIRPSIVYSRMPILKRIEIGQYTYFLYEDFPAAKTRKMKWGEFTKVAKQAGINRKLSGNSEIMISEAQSSKLSALWKDL